jgi:hypothetical protein
MSNNSSVAIQRLPAKPLWPKSVLPKPLRPELVLVLLFEPAFDAGGALAFDFAADMSEGGGVLSTRPMLPPRPLGTDVPKGWILAVDRLMGSEGGANSTGPLGRWAKRKAGRSVAPWVAALAAKAALPRRALSFGAEALVESEGDGAKTDAASAALAGSSLDSSNLLHGCAGACCSRCALARYQGELAPEFLRHSHTLRPIASKVSNPKNKVKGLT